MVGWIPFTALLRLHDLHRHLFPFHMYLVSLVTVAPAHIILRYLS